jgi:phosphoribosylaminoimidazole-succinocarboxamide synthase
VISYIPEGKTKIIRPKSESIASVISKKDLTAGNAAKHDLLEGKAEWANETTCNVFELLKACGIPLAYIKRESPVSFEAHLCRMLPWEVVTRRIVVKRSSYIQRYPTVRAGTVFKELKVEFYLKTKDREWKGISLPCDDPLAIITADGVYLYEPNIPFVKGTYFLRLRFDQVFEDPEDKFLLGEMARISIRSFLLVENAFAMLRCKLADSKDEYGISTEGMLLLADVKDNDSWRLLRGDTHLDKQGYRDGEDLETTKGKYELVAKLSKSLLPMIGYMKIWAAQHLDAKT